MSAVRTLIQAPWDSSVQAKVDVMGRNPLYELARAVVPTVVQMALQEGDPPTMFVAGDLPAYLASGADPKLLLRLPFIARHAAAAAQPAEFARMLEAYAGTEHGYMAAEMEGMGEAPGMTEYAARMTTWLKGV